MASAGELMAAAVEKTGLEDFGDDSFREGLEILVKALRDEARLNAPRRGIRLPRIGATSVSGCRSRTGTAVTRRSTTCRSTRRCSGSACRARAPPRCRSCWPRIREIRYLRRWESGAAVPAAVDRGGRRPANPAGAGGRRRQPGTTCQPTSHGPMECLDLMALDFKIADLPGLRPDPVVLRVVDRQGRSHVHLCATSAAC